MLRKCENWKWNNNININKIIIDKGARIKIYNDDRGKSMDRLLYYIDTIDTSVLLENNYTTRKIHKNYIRHLSGLFSTISHVSLSMTYFRSFPSIFLSMSFCLYNKKNITWRLEDMNFIFLFVKYFFATRK